MRHQRDVPQELRQMCIRDSPSFDAAARPETARSLYEHFVEALRTQGLRAETGQFQTDMQVELVNDGPVTILLDSQKLF